MGGHDLREDMSYFIEGHVCRITYSTRRNVLMENLSCRRTCLMGRHFLLEDMSTGEHVLLEHVFLEHISF